MSQSVAVSTIQSRVCTLCDLPAPTSDTSVTANAMLDLLKVSCSLLAGIVSSEYPGEMYFATSSTLTTVAGVPLVSTPSNFSDLLRLTWQKSDSEEIPLLRATPETMRAWPESWGDSECTEIYYRFSGSAIELFPTPDAAYTLNIHYSTGLYPASTASTFIARDGWDQWITLQTCVLVRARQQKDATDFVMALEKLEAAIRRQIKRDRYGVRQIRDLRGDAFSPITYPRKPA